MRESMYQLLDLILGLLRVRVKITSNLNGKELEGGLSLKGERAVEAGERMLFDCSEHAACTPSPSLFEEKDAVATGFLLNIVCTFYLCRLLAGLV